MLSPDMQTFENIGIETGQRISSKCGFRRFSRCFVRCCEGVAAAEFALSLPLLAIFLFNIMAFGSVVYLESNMETAARDAARRMASSEATFAGIDVSCNDAAAQIAGSAENVACRNLPNWGMVFTVNARELCPGDNSVLVEVSVPGDAAIMDIFGLFAGKTLRANQIMRLIDPCA